MTIDDILKWWRLVSQNHPTHDATEWQTTRFDNWWLIKVMATGTWHDLIFNVTIVHVVDDPLRLRPTNEASDLPPQYYINISTIPLHRIKWHWKWKGKIGQHRRRTVQKKDKATPTKTKVEKKAGKNIVFHSNRDLNIKNPRIFTLEGQIFTEQGHLNFKCPS